jgi:hypothetical protein
MMGLEVLGENASIGIPTASPIAYLIRRSICTYRIQKYKYYPLF